MSRPIPPRQIELRELLVGIEGLALLRRLFVGDDADGASAFMRNHGHVHSDYLAAFAAAGLEVRRCMEPRFGEEHVAAQGLGIAFVPDATHAAYFGLPGALVWDLVRSSG